MSSQAPTAPKSTGTWLSRWEPEDQAFWSAGGSAIAWRTLALTTVNLTLAFAAWFLVSALVVRLPQVGYTFSASQLFWLTAMPGLAGGTLRLVHMFLTPMVGTRHVVSLSTLSLLVPLVGWFFAVQDPSVPYWVLLLLSFFAGLGGGNFSSFMPSTSLFFPKRLLGTALAIQAGIGNLGVSIVQFVTPWIIGVALLGGATFMGDSQTLVKNGVESQVHLQNAAAVFIPFVVVFGITAWLLLKSVPVKANFAEQFDIFKSKHNWSMTSLYMMTFGGFSGLAATFPLLIKQGFGGFEGAPDPLKYAFWGRWSARWHGSSPGRCRTSWAARASPSGQALAWWCVRRWWPGSCRLIRWRPSRPSLVGCSRCSSSPASVMPPPSSRCRCCSRRARPLA